MTESNNRLALIIGFGFLILFIIAVYALHVIRQEGTKCYAEPLQYAINHYSKENSAMSCTCGFSDARFLPFIINQDGKQVLEEFIPKNTGLSAMQSPAFNLSLVQP